MLQAKLMKRSPNKMWPPASGLQCYLVSDHTRHSRRIKRGDSHSLIISPAFDGDPVIKRVLAIKRKIWPRTNIAPPR